ncbi:MAG: hypothetical protein IPN59_04360 [Holophaga sp.]|nr:hypothetical protein [Holophaga sp.]
MAKADQDCRMAGGSCAQEDEIRQRRVLTLLAEGKVNEPEAKECAALILQHSGLTLCDGRYQAISLDNFQLAHLLAKAAAEKGRRSARWLAAASLDRYLVFSESLRNTEPRRCSTLPCNAWWCPLWIPPPPMRNGQNGAWNRWPPS